MKNNERILRRILFIGAALVLALDALALPARFFIRSAELTGELPKSILSTLAGRFHPAPVGWPCRVLVDAGTAESGDTIDRYLEELGVRELYAVVPPIRTPTISAAWRRVIEAFPIGHFFMGRETANTATYGSMLDALEARGLPSDRPATGRHPPFDSGPRRSRSSGPTTMYRTAT